MRYRLASGVRVEPLANCWAAFSGVSGDTMLLNTEAAAVIELLASADLDEARIAETLAADTGTELPEVNEALRHIWGQLVSAGLIELAEAHEHNPG